MKPKRLDRKVSPRRKEPRLPWKTISIPKNAELVELNESFLCARYVRLVAHKLFGYQYHPANGWDFGKKNSIVWSATDPQENRDFEEVLRPGQALGIFLPMSQYNRTGRLFTHVSLFVGKEQGKHVVLHMVGKTMRKDILEDFLKRTQGELMQVIEPSEK